MIQNETMQSILARRSYKVFDSRPIDDEAYIPLSQPASTRPRV